MTELKLDGDGQSVESSETVYDETGTIPTVKTTHYVRSSVLGGAVVTELNQAGQKQRTLVYQGGAVLAWQQVSGSGTESVAWEHRDAGGASFRMTGAVMAQGGPAEMDPLNANTGPTNPYLSPPTLPDEGGNAMMPYPSFSNPTQLGTTYTIDGIRVTSDYFMSLVQSGRVGGQLGLFESMVRASPRLSGERVYDAAGRLVGGYSPAERGRALAMAFEYHGTLVRDWLVNDNWGVSSSLFGPGSQNVEPVVNTNNQKEESEECKKHRANLLENPQNLAALKKAWDRSKYKTSTL